MQASVEADFAAAVLFLQTYNGPHRILRNPTSSVRLDFDALFQQATLGSCSTTAPMDGMEQSSWTKWKALGNMSKEAAMQKYIKMMDDLVDNWRRSSSFRVANAPATAQPTMQSLIERLPTVVAELDDIKARIHFDSQRHEELSEALNTLSYDTKTTFTRELRQVDVLRSELFDKMKRIEKQLQDQKVESTALTLEMKELNRRLDGSIFFQAQRYGAMAWQLVVRWSAYRVTHLFGAFLAILMVWRHVFKSKLPRWIADPLIKMIAHLARHPKQQSLK
ncbi:hypothetical protein AC1031_004637 [Aphanomyces cochlioides]|nr:hypothetical protein AC1031_004637 [Aphanomyces cochlioides]